MDAIVAAPSRHPERDGEQPYRRLDRRDRPRGERRHQRGFQARRQQPRTIGEHHSQQHPAAASQARQRHALLVRSGRILQRRRGFRHAADEPHDGMTGARTHAEAAERRQREHRRMPSRVERHEEVPSVVIAKRELGHPDDEVPMVCFRACSQSRERDVHVLGTESERLAHELDIPPRWICARGRGQVGHPARDIGGRCRIGHEPYANRLHVRTVHPRSTWFACAGRTHGGLPPTPPAFRQVAPQPGHARRCSSAPRASHHRVLSSAAIAPMYSGEESALLSWRAILGVAALRGAGTGGGS